MEREPVTATPEARALLGRVDSLIFDVDGVLIDITDSIRQVNLLSVDFYFERIAGWGPTRGLVDSSDIERFKNAGGFNSDWDLTRAIVLLYLLKWARSGETDPKALRAQSPTVREYTTEIARRGGWLQAAQEYVEEVATGAEMASIRAHWDPAIIDRIFQEFYGGELCPELYDYQPCLLDYSTHRGLIHRDRPLIDPARVPARLKLGVVTGRTRTETVVGMRLIGMNGRIPPEHMVTDDDGIRKPDPAILQLVAGKLGTRVGIYVGDTLDDLRTVKMHQEAARPGDARLIACQVLTGPGGKRNRALFQEHGAEIIANSVNDLLEIL